MPTQDLALWVLDHLIELRPAERQPLLHRGRYISDRVFAALHDVRRAGQRGVIQIHSDEAHGAFPEYARALAEAWALLETQGYLVAAPGGVGRVFVSRDGERARARYRDGESASGDARPSAAPTSGPASPSAPANHTPSTELFREIFEDFQRSGDWPDVSHLQRRLAREGKDIDVRAQISESADDLVFIDVQQVVLTPAGLARVEEAATLLAHYRQALLLAYSRYLSEDPDPQLTSQDLGDLLGLGPSEAQMLSRLLLRDAPGLGDGSGDVENGWSRRIGDGIRVARDAEDVDTLLRAITNARRDRALSLHPTDTPSAPGGGALRAAWRFLKSKNSDLKVWQYILIAVVVILLATLILWAIGLLNEDDPSPRTTPERAGVTMNVDGHPAARDPKGFSFSSTSFWFPGSLRDVGRPPGPDAEPWRACRRWRPWALRRGGYEADRSFVELTVSARANTSVVINGLDVTVMRGTAKRGVSVACASGGAEPNRRRIFVDLDREPPAVTYAGIEQAPGRRPLQFTLRGTETEVLELSATTRRCRCQWRGRLHLLVDGRQRSLAIDDHGRAFRTAATGRSRRFIRGSDGWERAR